MGTTLAQLGHAAFPSWATCLPRMGRISVRGLPNKLMLQYSHSCFQTSANACNTSHLTIPLISKPSRQLPDNRQAANCLFVRMLQSKTRWSDSFFGNSRFY